MRHLTIASLFLLAGCATPIRPNLQPPPAEWLVCKELPAKPDLEPLQAFTLPDGRQAYLKSDVDARDAHIARYVVEANGLYFECWNNMQRLKNYY